MYNKMERWKTIMIDELNIMDKITRNIDFTKLENAKEDGEYLTAQLFENLNKFKEAAGRYRKASEELQKCSDELLYEINEMQEWYAQYLNYFENKKGEI